MIKIITVYDNVDYDKKFQSDWGFGCIIDHPDARILFDTGAKSDVLQANLKAASILPGSMDIIVLSHKHWDHKGGASWIIEQNPKISVYMPDSYFKYVDKLNHKYRQNITHVKKNIEIKKNFQLIVCENFWIRELAMVLKTSQGAVVLTGCSHTGIHKILSKVRDATDLQILSVLGGFHLFRSSENSIVKLASTLKKINIQKIAPCHCTGDAATTILKREFPTQFVQNGVGAEFVFNA